MTLSVSGQIVLLIEDNPGDARLIREMLAEDPAGPFRLTCVDRLSLAFEALAVVQPALTLLDLGLPDSQGLESFSKVYSHSPNIPIIVLTGDDNQTVALNAVKAGAQDFLVKSKLNAELLVRAMHYSIERKRYQQQLERQANYDELTGLPNRQLLNDRLKRSVFGRREKRSVAIVFIDIDRFKVVNDSLGHSSGDKLLKLIADRLRAETREVDTVARIGGDEFVIILHDQPRSAALVSAMQRIFAAVNAPVEVDNRELNITCSAGISLYPQDGLDVETLLRNADTAMYRAKAQGRNNFQFFTAEMNQLANERLTLEHSLRRAIERKELLLYYQPRIDLKTARVQGVEALVRWQHPELGLIGPERFISLAEETGLIVPIGDWVLRHACVQGRKWEEASSPRIVSVNVSARQFRSGDFAQQVTKTLSETGLQPRYLELEFTESMLMHDADQVIAALQALKLTGVRLSIDDFGTGYSSLSYLKQLPVDAIKIGASFVRDIDAGGPNGGILAQVIIFLGHVLNHAVIAEGVETKAQLDFLAAHGCDEAQGYYLGKPIPSEQLRPVW